MCFFLCSWRDSNPQPLDGQPNTLTTEPTRHPVAGVSYVSWYEFLQLQVLWRCTNLACTPRTWSCGWFTVTLATSAVLSKQGRYVLTSLFGWQFLQLINACLLCYLLWQFAFFFVSVFRDVRSVYFALQFNDFQVVFWHWLVRTDFMSLYLLTLCFIWTIPTYGVICCVWFHDFFVSSPCSCTLVWQSPLSPYTLFSFLSCPCAPQKEKGWRMV